MARRLTTTVQLGDVIYAAGTDEADIDAALVGSITADVWAGARADSSEESKVKAPSRRAKAAEPAPEG